MRRLSSLLALALAAAVSLPAFAADKDNTKPSPSTTPPGPTESTTQGMLTTEHIAYTAVAGTIIVGATNDQDADLNAEGKPVPGSPASLVKDPKDAPPTASMFYVAYFKKDADSGTRPIT
jgi:hypothetical protein